MTQEEEHNATVTSRNRFKIRSRKVFDVLGQTPEIFTIKDQKSWDHLWNIHLPSLGPTTTLSVRGGAIVAQQAKPTIRSMLESGASDFEIMENCVGATMTKIKTLRHEIDAKREANNASSKLMATPPTPWFLFQETLVRISHPRIICWFADTIASSKGTDLASALSASGKALVLYSCDVTRIRLESAAWEAKFGRIGIVIFDVASMGIRMSKADSLTLCQTAENIRDGKIILGRSCGSAPPSVFIFSQTGPIISTLDEGVCIDRWLLCLPKFGHAVGHVVLGSEVPVSLITSVLGGDSDDVPIIQYRALINALSFYEASIFEIAGGETVVDAAFRNLWSRFGLTTLEYGWELGLEPSIKYAAIAHDIRTINPNQIGQVCVERLQMTPSQHAKYQEWTKNREMAFKQSVADHLNVLNAVRNQYGFNAVDLVNVKERTIMPYNASGATFSDSSSNGSYPSTPRNAAPQYRKPTELWNVGLEPCPSNVSSSATIRPYYGPRSGFS